VKQLECAGADFLVLPCNTLHTLAEDIRKNTKVEFLDLVEAVSEEINGRYGKIGILGTTKTRDDGIYDRVLKDVEITYPNNAEQKRVSDIIIRIIRGGADSKDKAYLDKLINKMIDSGAEKVLLACTDLPNLVRENSKTLDSTETLIKVVKEKISRCD
jgi:aspartate racemase